MNDDEMAETMAIILAAYGEKFPQLRGKAVRPDRTDDARARFARLMVEKLGLSHIRFYREKSDQSLMLNTGCFKPHK